MDKLSKLLHNIIRLDRNIILKSVYNEAFKKFAIDLNRIDQLYNVGEDSNGDVLQAYTANTVSIKARKGQPTDRTTLKDTGDFYRSFNLKFYETDFEIMADDTDKGLFDKYGKDIVGWTKENTNEIKLFIQKRFLEETINRTFKSL
ncbi:MAG: hypothetical protein WBF67_00240 [Olleya sp.]